jgi:hypothetical protein
VRLSEEGRDEAVAIDTILRALDARTNEVGEVRAESKKKEEELEKKEEELKKKGEELKKKEEELKKEEHLEKKQLEDERLEYALQMLDDMDKQSREGSKRRRAG